MKIISYQEADSIVSKKYREVRVFKMNLHLIVLNTFGYN
jgi:hypothetical protein